VLGVGLIMTGHVVLTPMLRALSMLTGDVVTMSRGRSRKADALSECLAGAQFDAGGHPVGRVQAQLLCCGACHGVVRAAPRRCRMRTLTFAMLVYAGQANVYVLREKGPLWNSRPAPIMLLASLADVGLVTILVLSGVLVSPLSLGILGVLILATVGFALAMDGLKRLVFNRLNIDRREI
jgi:H+-transporting ATPase